MWIKIALIGFTIRLIAIFCAPGPHSPAQGLSKTLFNQDYQVSLDASLHPSPYDTHTFRSSPLLAYILAPTHRIHPLLGKIILAVFDALAIAFIYKVFENRSSKTKQANLKAAKIISYLYSLNPILIYVTTTGNSEPITLALAAAFWFFYFGDEVHGNMSPIERADNLLSERQPSPIRRYFSYALFGLWAHFSLYPIIFVPLLVMHEYHSVKENRTQHAAKFAIEFLLVSGGVFLTLGLFFYGLYGIKFIQETYLYYLSNRDGRHSKSPYFFEIYLNYSTDLSAPSSSRVLNRILPSLLAFLMISFVFVKKRSVFFCQGMLTCFLVIFNRSLQDHLYALLFCAMYLGIPELDAFRKKKWSMVVTRALKDVLIAPLPVLLWFLMALRLQHNVGEIKIWHVWLCSMFILSIHGLLVSKFFMEMKPWSAEYEQKLRIEQAKRILSARNKDD